MRVSYGEILLDTVEGGASGKKPRIYVRASVAERLHAYSADMTIGQAKRVHAWLGRVIARAEREAGQR